MTFRKFPYYCVLFIVTLSTLFLSCNNILLEKKDADFSVKISMPPVYSTTAGSDPLTGEDISTESPAEKWNLIAWVEEAGTKKQLGYEEKKAVDGTVAIYFENIPIGKYIHVFVEVYSATGDLCYKGSSEGKEPHLVEDTNKKISISLDKYYKVIFYNGNEIVETKYVKQGETAGKPKNLTGENPFKGWSTQEPSPEYTQEIYDFNEPITENITLYAVWGNPESGDENEPVTPPEGGDDPDVGYEITFDLDGGSFIGESKENPVTIASGGGIDLKDYQAEKNGFVFMGWYVDDDYSEKVELNDDGIYIVTGDITLYAKWEEELEVIFNKGTYNTVGSSDKVSLVYEANDKDSWGVISNEAYSDDDIWANYLRLTSNDDAMFKTGNYEVSLALKAENTTVVAISAARADMYFTVTDKWKTYTFETGNIGERLEEELNAISIGVGKTSKLYIANVSVTPIDANGLPTLSFNLENDAIKNYLSSPLDKQGNLKSIIDVAKTDTEDGYKITINTASENEDGITLALRGYAEPGLNVASFNLISNNSSLTCAIKGSYVSYITEGTERPYEQQVYCHQYEPEKYSSDVLNIWANNKDIANKNFIPIPIPGSKNESYKPYSIDGILKSVSSGDEITISNFKVENDTELPSSFTFIVDNAKEGNSWERVSLSTQVHLNEVSGKVIFLTSNEWEKYEWNAAYNCKFLKYYVNGVEQKDYSYSIPKEGYYNITLTDDFTVQITEVESDSGETSGDTGNDSGTGDSSNNANTGTEATIISDEVNGLQYVSINNVSGIYIHNDVGLKTYSQMVNGTLEKTITFNNDNGDFLQSFSAGTSYYLNGYLMDDVTVSDWVPIGTSDNPFTTSFDGQGHTITIKNIDETNSGDYAGLFGCIKAATITNLSVEGNISSSATNIGGIAGLGYGTITNCVNNIYFEQSDTSTENTYYIGGIIGNANNSQTKIDACVNKGVLNGHDYVGGIAGYSTGATITNCVNFADLEATGYETTYAGGIVGANVHGSTSISNCVNIGRIQSNSPDTSDSYISGIVGYVENWQQQPFSISDCLNLGEIAGRSTISGILYAKKATDNTYVIPSISSCINVGSMTGSSVYAIANEGIESDCYYDNQQITGSILLDSNYVTGKSSEEICKLTQNDLSSYWSFDTNRYPLPDLSNVFTQTIWNEIVEAATL